MMIQVVVVVVVGTLVGNNSTNDRREVSEKQSELWQQVHHWDLHLRNRLNLALESLARESEEVVSKPQWKNFVLEQSPLLWQVMMTNDFAVAVVVAYDVVTNLVVVVVFW